MGVFIYKQRTIRGDLLISRSGRMAQLLRLSRLSAQCERTGQSAEEALGQDGLRDAGRRRFAQGAIAGVATAVAGTMAPIAWAKSTDLRRIAMNKLMVRGNVAVVGAGLAGLVCAAELARLGISAKVFEADARVGGRVRSLRGHFPGQTVELGGEFIGRSHNTMLGYVRQFGLTLEDASQFRGSAITTSAAAVTPKRRCWRNFAASRRRSGRIWKP